MPPVPPGPTIPGPPGEDPVPGLPGATKTKPDSKGQFQMHIPMATAAGIFRVQATPENMKVFVDWLKTFDRPGMLGPSEFKPSDKAGVKRDQVSDPAKVRQLQTALARRGYQVQASGTWDQATSSAVVQFKHARGIHENFKTPDGKWAITPFADESVTAQILGG
jgi:hypothetical protein